ncbi:hypothetical protein [Humibacillus xanthopallidus]|nr:hypothetical protein [Humibacillus xanthopallidus]
MLDPHNPAHRERLVHACCWWPVRIAGAVDDDDDAAHDCTE